MTTATTSAMAAPVAMIFAINDDLVFRALEGLTHAELWHAPTDRNNPMLWVAGHVVQTRAVVLQLLGEPVETGWGDVFDRGATIGDADRLLRAPRHLPRRTDGLHPQGAGREDERADPHHARAAQQPTKVDDSHLVRGVDLLHPQRHVVNTEIREKEAV